MPATYRNIFPSFSSEDDVDSINGTPLAAKGLNTPLVQWGPFSKGFGGTARSVMDHRHQRQETLPDFFLQKKTTNEAVNCKKKKKVPLL